MLEKARRLIRAARHESNPHVKQHLREIGGIFHKQSKARDGLNIIFFDDAKARRDERRARRSYRDTG
jgi:hypothetical protein